MILSTRNSARWPPMGSTMSLPIKVGLASGSITTPPNSPWKAFAAGGRQWVAPFIRARVACWSPRTAVAATDIGFACGLCNYRNWRMNYALVVHPLNQCDFRRCCDTETTWDAMAPSATPDKGVLVGVPVIGGTLYGLLDLGPCLKATPLQRKRAQHLPPRLQQVQIGGIDRLEHKLPTRVNQREQQHVHGGVGVEIVHHRIDPVDSRIDPALDLAEEVNPVRC